MRIVIIPGMGCTPISQVNWYSWFEGEMKKRNHQVILRDFPDPYHCKESVWIPFLLNDIGITDDTIVVGHSSGAACAMRLLERAGEAKHTDDETATTCSNIPSPSTDSCNCPHLAGAVLVAAAYTDLGIESERRSEYFNRPWNWDKMKQGAREIVCFHGVDDHLIPVREARYIAEKLKGDNFRYIEMKGASHFFDPWDEILQVIDQISIGH